MQHINKDISGHRGLGKSGPTLQRCHYRWAKLVRTGVTKIPCRKMNKRTVLIPDSYSHSRWRLWRCHQDGWDVTIVSELPQGDYNGRLIQLCAKVCLLECQVNRLSHSNSTFYLLDGHKGMDLPPQLKHREVLAHLPDLEQDEKWCVKICQS